MNQKRKKCGNFGVKLKKQHKIKKNEEMREKESKIRKEKCKMKNKNGNRTK